MIWRPEVITEGRWHRIRGAHLTRLSRAFHDAWRHADGSLLYALWYPDDGYQWVLRREGGVPAALPARRAVPGTCPPPPFADAEERITREEAA